MPFEELVRAFPDLQTSTTSQILAEVKKLRRELDEMRKSVGGEQMSEVKKEEQEEEQDG